LEHDELKEVQRILRELTARLSVYSPLLLHYLDIIGEFDFIKAKAQLAVQMNANLPNITDKALVILVDAYHPLLFLYHKESGKKTIPV
ncbi:hypothetical protein ABTD95_19560, partial [Acinetobacter baumannii]